MLWHEVMSSLPPNPPSELPLRTLDESSVDPDPIRQFAAWFQQAVDAGLAEPTAMTLATATRAGRPSARIVLMKGFDHEGFTFFTNYESRKSAELEQNPFAAAVFYWQALDRQVRITGRVERISAQESEAYFRTRPIGSRLGAWASAQSRALSSRRELEARVREMEQRFAGQRVPLPPFWGGYRLRPDAVEFWQGRPDRLHDRLLYSAQGEQWNLERLFP
jgi:pyridoxamine 5'-phosphate oxidase